MAPRNLVNLAGVAKGFGSRSVLRDVTLGVSEGDRIGVVGRNGDGKSTLLRLIADTETADDGAVTRERGLRSVLLGQGDDLGEGGTIREALVGGMADHEWAGDSAFREVLDGLMGGVGMARFPLGLDTPIGPLSGGERRRIALAGALLHAPELLLLDEPTNHLDVEAVDWLAHHLAARRGSLLVVTHDRWFLDAVCTATWEVADGGVLRYEGGYAAYVLARAERERREAVQQERRQNLLRKELAWLRRGPPARTSKPRFRIDAANALIADEPEPRDRAELLRFASSRLGDRVLDAVDVSVAYDGRPVLRARHLAARARATGSRSSAPTARARRRWSGCSRASSSRRPGVVERGATVRLAHLSQDTAEIPGHLRVLESLEAVRGEVTLADGREITAGLLCDRFGFRGEKARTPVRDLSGGERRRLQLMRLLMEGPNVLLLDEPTNDLDTDTLTALEDLLDSWAGTLVVVSHDRYFVERACDDVFAITGDGGLRHLPGGIDQYLALRAAERPAPAPVAAEPKAPPAGAVVRATRKEVARLERALERLGAREASLHEAMAAAATDFGRLGELQAELSAVVAEREAAEEAWLEASSALEG